MKTRFITLAATCAALATLATLAGCGSGSGRLVFCPVSSPSL